MSTAENRGEQEEVRRDKLQKLRSIGYPYPNDVRVSAISNEIVKLIEDASDVGTLSGQTFTIAGRIMSLRLMGKAAFCHIQDRGGRIQVYLKKDDIGDEAFERFKNFDLGDIVEISGYPFRTKTNEPSLHGKSIRLLVKCLHPLPEKWHGLTDVEVRYRKRYVDLMVNPEVRETFRIRSKIISAIRRFFDERDYLEVETPVLTPVVGGANARPFRTHHNTLGLDLNLRIALELPLKRLVVGGLDRVYEIGRVFRNEGISTEHNPEFTIIEFYQAYATYEDLMNLTEELIVRLCDEVLGRRKLEFDGKALDFSPPWKRLTMAEAIYEIGGVARSFDLNSLSGVKLGAKSVGLDLEAFSDHGSAFYELFDRHVESKIVNPTFITRFPSVVSPLSRPSLDDPNFVDRFELMIAGMEIANAFSELNDSEDQERRFLDQLEAKKRGDEEAMDMDKDFVEALEYGLPPTAGEGIGIDRLVMLLSGQVSIRDVILFPQMRPSIARDTGS